MILKDKCCSVDNCENKVVNAFHKLCHIHNRQRLQANSPQKPKKEKTENKREKLLNPVNRPQKQKRDKIKTKKQSANMRDLFLEIWNEREHVCIICSKQLGDEPLAHFFSHRKARNVVPSLKYDKSNIDILCLDCHRQRDFGYKK